MPHETFTEANATDLVLARLGADINPRLKEVMTSVITHFSDDVRQEYILLSDTLGVSRLVDSINNRKSLGGTESTVLGPFYASGSPIRQLGDNIAAQEGGEYLESDTVFGVKDSLVVDFKRVDDPAKAAAKGFSGAFRDATYDFVLEPVRVTAGDDNAREGDMAAAGSDKV